VELGARADVNTTPLWTGAVVHSNVATGHDVVKNQERHKNHELELVPEAVKKGHEKRRIEREIYGNAKRHAGILRKRHPGKKVDVRKNPEADIWQAGLGSPPSLFTALAPHTPRGPIESNTDSAGEKLQFDLGRFQRGLNQTNGDDATYVKQVLDSRAKLDEDQIKDLSRRAMKVVQQEMKDQGTTAISAAFSPAYMVYQELQDEMLQRAKREREARHKDISTENGQKSRNSSIESLSFFDPDLDRGIDEQPDSSVTSLKPKGRSFWKKFK
jgi:hypothetical protein